NVIEGDVNRDPDTQVTRLLYEPGQSAVRVQVTPGRPLLAQDLQPALVLAALGLGARRQVAEERPVSCVVHHHGDAGGWTGDALGGRQVDPGAVAVLFRHAGTEILAEQGGHARAGPAPAGGAGRGDRAPAAGDGELVGEDLFARGGQGRHITEDDLQEYRAERDQIHGAGPDGPPARMAAGAGPAPAALTGRPRSRRRPGRRGR